ncbi:MULTISPECIES: 2-oxo-hept-4-ene-1,7-dioate hydratase [unclassified Chelatococcus]|jgi:2-oxo-hept-3-ene-1,7-dioate hydratase|uniref:2-oxo-hept-4-ene-1,7-dioate hydratase n=1 Tax=unclassified Chelatococcus TaxID=2638111 RepID=UPI001BCFD37B|nr:MULTISPECIES: 2-oxo-hepta-3-ene-1,7-dioic acid hydratase [unclassified Chelatococcus]CAH1649213.1 2-oxo-hept-4-ene-1,7-dioate hydratase [Hyphomicrobiales bacterium]MBS7741795.1 2-oxo-hepta-3-ene-1,7-dioic acid hydratase [Chelatococcus sp. HY11]MBX3541407.1 2-oxo-hepta-3-ene-1,7-dioic acid hydratase [Chelatococcus sp.]MCO5074699.1 2-oxo-hepta-3-ene-1,7-dioic acid hydratase [Chelatococcus sp.]CAH1691788.1 2-oxo-hept-4-ene-1,7-dioate hydratase [Hyphomicrobiales bacterium]
MLSESDITTAAADLVNAEREQRQIALLSLRHPHMDMADAYRIQEAFVAAKRAEGDRHVGWKIGLTSRAMQQALAIDTPDSGYLLASMRFDDGATVPSGRFIQPRVEAELAFVMKRDPGVGASVHEVMDATDYVVPVLEILDTRIARRDAATGTLRNVCDTIADNAANAGFVLGGRPMRPRDLDLRWAGAIVSRNAVVEETGVGAGVLNHPAKGIAWLADRLAANGHRLEPGQIVLSGSFVRPIECPPGSTINADYGPLGTIACHFA